MTERKNKKMKSHMNLVKGLTCIWFLATFVCVPLTKTFIQNFVDDVIDVYYEDVHNQVSTVNETKVVISDNEPMIEAPSQDYKTQGTENNLDEALGEFK
jgi:hypothetical protein